MLYSDVASGYREKIADIIMDRGCLKSPKNAIFLWGSEKGSYNAEKR
jgi:hypothetical protein